MSEREPGDLEHLAVYGSLRPGEPNHWVVRSIPGTWQPATLRGWTFEITWGPASGYDGFLPDPDGAAVEVDVLSGPSLVKRLREVDDFEGPGYQRREVEAELGDGSSVVAWVYVALTDAE